MTNRDTLHAAHHNDRHEHPDNNKKTPDSTSSDYRADAVDRHNHDNHRDSGIHVHEHAHGGVKHRHAHYHTPPGEDAAEAPHQHAHAYEFELYAYADSPIHRLDARTKTITLISFIIAMVLTPVAETWRFGLFAMFVAALYIIAGIPLLFGIKRSIIVLPFVVSAGILLAFMPDKPHPPAYDLGFVLYPIRHGGLYVLLNALVKSWISVFTVALLYSTTPFPRFIRGIEALHAPRVLTILLSFLYRFIWVITDEIKRMLRARDARAFGGSRRWHLQVLGKMIGSLFIRSYERAERVYAAMVSRGYDGTIKTFEVPAIAWRDGVFATAFFAILCAILLWRL